MSEDIFSVRLVVVDFYMHRPTLDLDICYSELQGKEIKKVPIIRVFGSTVTGQKTCLHIHGVFPYFYIPYEQKDFESLNKAKLTIASNVDKAINISLGQGSSNVQHVFKIQLVKGIPFYGYHHGEHQFLKIYMFNPKFVRRAANLLQNGSIMSKAFHPYESHVPYILQFMIDFNLYGMSLLHVPFEIVKFRRRNDNDDIPYPKVRPTQILNAVTEKKMSTSSLEADISSAFILNRFQLLIKKGVTHTNPGIESIWKDEHLRRQELAQKDDSIMLPALEIPISQERSNLKAAESEIFHRNTLISKLQALKSSTQSSNSSNQTLNSIQQTTLSNSIFLDIKERKSTFSLTKLMENAVYPEECNPAVNLVNASFIENHLSTTQCLQKYTKFNTKKDLDSKFHGNIFIDDTVVDEELFLHLSQSQSHISLNSSLRDEDKKLLDILQQLEEDNDNGLNVDLNSTLAPLLHPIDTEMLENGAKINKSVKQFIPTAGKRCDNDDDDEANVQDFSIALDDIDEFILKLTQSQPTQIETSPSHVFESIDVLYQTDGADDLLRTPTKRKSTMHYSNQKTTGSPRSPQNQTVSPRTPKYKPLPIIFTSHSSTKKITDVKQLTKLAFPSHLNLDAKISPLSLHKQLAVSMMCQKNVYPPCEINSSISNVAGFKANTQIRHMQKYDKNNLDQTHITYSLTPPNRRSERRLKVYNVQNNEIVHFQKSNSPEVCISNEKNPIRNVLSENKKNAKKLENTIEEPKIDADEIIMASDDEDLKAHFGKFRKVHCSNRLKNSCFVNRTSEEVSSEDVTATLQPCIREFDDNVCVDVGEENDFIESFYDRSCILNSPSVFSDLSSPIVLSAEKIAENRSPITESLIYANNIISKSRHESVVITPLNLPPTYKEVLKGCNIYNLPEFEHQEPYYADPNDISKCKEIGHTVLYIHGNKLNDCVEFKSLLGIDLQNINELRKKRLLLLGGRDLLQKHHSSQSMREHFASNKKSVTIVPIMEPPTKQDAILWLNARKLLSKKRIAYGAKPDILKDCPQEVSIMLNAMERNEDTDIDSCLSMTPSTRNNTSDVKQDFDSKQIQVIHQTTDSLRLESRRFYNLSELSSLLSNYSSKTDVVNEQLKESLHPVRSIAAYVEFEQSSDVQELQMPNTSHSTVHGFSSSLNNTFGFKVNLENLQKAKADIEYNYLTILTLEIFATTRGELFPNPKMDEMRCLFYAVEHSMPPNNELPRKACGFIIVNDKDNFLSQNKRHGLDKDIDVQVVQTEIDAIQALLELCHRWDPDIYAGYEIEMSSWGYLLERSKILCLNIGPLLSRIPTQKIHDFVDEERDSYTDLDIEPPPLPSSATSLCSSSILTVFRYSLPTTASQASQARQCMNCCCGRSGAKKDERRQHRLKGMRN